MHNPLILQCCNIVCRPLVNAVYIFVIQDKWDHPVLSRIDNVITCGWIMTYEKPIFIEQVMPQVQFSSEN